MVRARAALLLLVIGCKGTSARRQAPAASDASPRPSPPPAAPLDCTTGEDDWPMYGHDVCNTRTAGSGHGLTPENAHDLSVKWVFSASGDISATPAVVRGQVYVPDWSGRMYRIDGSSGHLVWSFSAASLSGFATDGGNPPDTVIARVTPVVTKDALIFATSRTGFTSPLPLDYVVAVHPDTGALLWKTLLDPHRAAVITGSPVLDNGRIFVGVASLEERLSALPGYPCCSFRGSVVALDAATGAALWKTPMIDDALYYAGDGRKVAGYSGAAIWSGTPTIDRARSQIYVTTGNNYTMPPGVDVAPPGDHVDSIVALDLETGAIKWSRAMTASDVWTRGHGDGPDFDFGCGANLLRASVNGKVRDLVGAGQKSGTYWALDAETGEVVWKTEVGPGGRLGGIQWGTATDGARIYFGVNDQSGVPYRLGGTRAHGGEVATVGSWGALDPSTGVTLWQVANPAMPVVHAGVSVNGPVSTVGGVVLGGSMDVAGTMLAIDAASGDVLWSFQSGGTVYGGAAVADGVIYWGSGYPASRMGFGSESKKLYAFSVSATR